MAGTSVPIDLGQVSLIVKTSNVSVEWQWTDWLGTGALLLIISLIFTGFIAMKRGANPLRVM